jgi:hypothetical protein
MNLQEWRQRGETETLPSGLAVRYVEVSLLDLAMNGEIPAPLVGVVDRLLNDEEDVEIELEDFTQMAPLINNLIKAALVDPPVADEPDATHLGVEELPATDRLFLFNRLHKEAQRLEPFRAGTDEPVDAAPTGDGLRAAAERDTGTGDGDVDGLPGGPGDAAGGADD